MPDSRRRDAQSRRTIREALFTNILVEAGAGSGKTQMLAERMAAGVADGVYQIVHMAAVLVSCAASPAPSSESGGHEAQEAQRVSTLAATLAAGDLIVTNVHGQGASSGTVLDGTLRNTTATSIHLGVQLRRGLYLANRTASAQNMLATAVYERGGLYYLEDDEPFIEVLPHEVKEVTFKAYCLDFDLENPAATDSLAVQLVPPDLSKIIDNLLAYEQTAGDQEESTVRAQIAIWLAQGHAPEEIRERFSFTAADLDEAHRIIAGTF